MYLSHSKIGYLSDNHNYALLRVCNSILSDSAQNAGNSSSYVLNQPYTLLSFTRNTLDSNGVEFNREIATVPSHSIVICVASVT